MKKFELTSETKAFFGKTLYRIRALISFGDVSAGDLGGFVEKEENLDQSGDARVYGDAMGVRQCQGGQNRGFFLGRSCRLTQ